MRAQSSVFTASVFTVSLFTGLALAVTIASPQASDEELKLVREDSLRVTFIGFVSVDYVYAVFCGPDDSTVVLGVDGSAVQPFVAAHPGVPMIIKYRVFRGHVPVLGEGVVDQEVLVWARIGELDSETWWKSIERTLGYAAAREFSDQLESAMHTKAADKMECQ